MSSHGNNNDDNHQQPIPPSIDESRQMTPANNINNNTSATPTHHPEFHQQLQQQQLQQFRNSLEAIPAFSYIGLPIKIQYSKHNLLVQGYLANVTPELLIIHHCTNLLETPTAPLPSRQQPHEEGIDNNNYNNNTGAATTTTVTPSKAEKNNDLFLKTTPNACLLRKHISTAEPILFSLQLTTTTNDDHRDENNNNAYDNNTMHSSIITTRYHQRLQDGTTAQTLSSSSSSSSIFKLDLEMFTRRFIIQQALSQLTGEESRDPKVYLLRALGHLLSSSSNTSSNTSSNDYTSSNHLHHRQQKAVDEFVANGGFKRVQDELVKNVAKVHKIDSRLINLRNATSRYFGGGFEADGSVSGTSALSPTLRQRLQYQLFSSIFGNILGDVAGQRTRDNSAGGSAGDQQQQQQQATVAVAAHNNALNQLFAVLSHDELRYALRERKHIWYSRASYGATAFALVSSSLLAYSGYVYISLSGSNRILEGLMAGARLVSILLGAGGLLYTSFAGWEMLHFAELRSADWVGWIRRLTMVAFICGGLFGIIVTGRIVDKMQDWTAGGKSLSDVYGEQSRTTAMCSYFGANRCTGFDLNCAQGGRCPPSCGFNNDFTETCKTSMEEIILALARPMLILEVITYFFGIVSIIIHLCLEYLVFEIKDLNQIINEEENAAAVTNTNRIRNNNNNNNNNNE